MADFSKNGSPSGVELSAPSEGDSALNINGCLVEEKAHEESDLATQFEAAGSEQDAAGVQKGPEVNASMAGPPIGTAATPRQLPRRQERVARSSSGVGSSAQNQAGGARGSVKCPYVDAVAIARGCVIQSLRIGVYTDDLLERLSGVEKPSLVADRLEWKNNAMAKIEEGLNDNQNQALNNYIEFESRRWSLRVAKADIQAPVSVLAYLVELMRSDLPNLNLGFFDETVKNINIVALSPALNASKKVIKEQVDQALSSLKKLLGEEHGLGDAQLKEHIIQPLVSMADYRDEIYNAANDQVNPHLIRKVAVKSNKVLGDQGKLITLHEEIMAHLMQYFAQVSQKSRAGYCLTIFDDSLLSPHAKKEKSASSHVLGDHDLCGISGGSPVGSAMPFHSGFLPIRDLVKSGVLTASRVQRFMRITSGVANATQASEAIADDDRHNNNVAVGVTPNNRLLDGPDLYIYQEVNNFAGLCNYVSSLCDNGKLSDSVRQLFAQESKVEGENTEVIVNYLKYLITYVFTGDVDEVCLGEVLAGEMPNSTSDLWVFIDQAIAKQVVREYLKTNEVSRAISSPPGDIESGAGSQSSDQQGLDRDLLRRQVSDGDLRDLLRLLQLIAGYYPAAHSDIDYDMGGGEAAEIIYNHRDEKDTFFTSVTPSNVAASDPGHIRWYGIDVMLSEALQKIPTIGDKAMPTEIARAMGCCIAQQLEDNQLLLVNILSGYSDGNKLIVDGIAEVAARACDAVYKGQLWIGTKLQVVDALNEMFAQLKSRLIIQLNLAPEDEPDLQDLLDGLPSVGGSDVSGDMQSRRPSTSVVETLPRDHVDPLKECVERKNAIFSDRLVANSFHHMHAFAVWLNFVGPFERALDLLSKNSQDVGSKCEFRNSINDDIVGYRENLVQAISKIKDIAKIIARKFIESEWEEGRAPGGGKTLDGARRRIPEKIREMLLIFGVSALRIGQLPEQYVDKHFNPMAPDGRPRGMAFALLRINILLEHGDSDKSLRELYPVLYGAVSTFVVEGVNPVLEYYDRDKNKRVKQAMDAYYPLAQELRIKGGHPKGPLLELIKSMTTAQYDESQALGVKDGRMRECFVGLYLIVGAALVLDLYRENILDEVDGALDNDDINIICAATAFALLMPFIIRLCKWLVSRDMPLRLFLTNRDYMLSAASLLPIVLSVFEIAGDTHHGHLIAWGAGGVSLARGGYLAVRTGSYVREQKKHRQLTVSEAIREVNPRGRAELFGLLTVILPLAVYMELFRSDMHEEDRDIRFLILPIISIILGMYLFKKGLGVTNRLSYLAASACSYGQAVRESDEGLQPGDGSDRVTSARWSSPEFHKDSPANTTTLPPKAHSPVRSFSLQG